MELTPPRDPENSIRWDYSHRVKLKAEDVLMEDLILMIPVDVLRSPREPLAGAGEIDEAPGIDKEVGAAKNLDHGIWGENCKNWTLETNNLFRRR